MSDDEEKYIVITEDACMHRAFRQREPFQTHADDDKILALAGDIMRLRDDVMPPLTWTCEVCGKERPDAMIDVAVATGTLPASRSPFAVNVKYCNDDEDCRHSAQVVANHRRDELEGGEQLSLE